MMKLVAIACLLAVASAYLRFDGHSVHRIQLSEPVSDAEIAAIRSLHERVDIDFWSETDLRLTPEVNSLC